MPGLTHHGRLRHLSHCVALSHLTLTSTSFCYYIIALNANGKRCLTLCSHNANCGTFRRYNKKPTMPRPTTQKRESYKDYCLDKAKDSPIFWHDEALKLLTKQ